MFATKATSDKIGTISTGPSDEHLPLTMEINKLSNSDVAYLCSSENPYRQIISSIQGGAKVIKLSDEVAVKFGFSVTEDEANNQRVACGIVDSSIVRIPEVHRFFVAEGYGYLVMEYVNGKSVESFPDDLVVDKILHILAHFDSIQHDTPGALGGGPSRGRLWSEYHRFRPHSVHDVEAYYNEKQSGFATLDLKDARTVLCHMDLAKRNIAQNADGDWYLLDWASAGFYPRIFEICAMRLNTADSLGAMLLARLEKPTDLEEEQAGVIQFVALFSQRCIWCVRVHVSRWLPALIQFL